MGTRDFVARVVVVSQLVERRSEAVQIVTRVTSSFVGAIRELPLM